MVIEDVVSVLESQGFYTEKVDTHPNYHAIIGGLNSVRVYFIWRDNDGDLTFQIARVWEQESSQSLGVFPSVTSAIRQAKAKSTNLS